MARPGVGSGGEVHAGLRNAQTSGACAIRVAGMVQRARAEDWLALFGRCNTYMCKGSKMSGPLLQRAKRAICEGRARAAIRAAEH